MAIILHVDGSSTCKIIGPLRGMLLESILVSLQMLGTPYYLSPEICSQKPYNQKV